MGGIEFVKRKNNKKQKIIEEQIKSPFKQLLSEYIYMSSSSSLQVL